MMCSRYVAVFFAFFSTFYGSLADTSLASATVLTIWFPPNPGCYGSVIEANPTDTTYAFQCVPGGGAPLTQINGPSTVSFDATGTNSGPSVYQTLAVDCSITGMTAGLCTFSMVKDHNTTILTNSVGENDLTANLGPATITAGLEKLPSSVAASTTASTAAPSPTSSSASKTGASTPASTPNAAGMNEGWSTKTCALVATVVLPFAFVAAWL